ncbi:protein ABHD8 isoform X2 [Tribolium castaneum]|uniref:acylglycerol lipase n=1 Tax=Tribolium castaneum TaxID=7070 RepID=D6W6G0_TRICA|nr:PREDICTED: protein ABHD8 isoform X2 [Tribolium castaneum]EFA11067.2 Abhydrolase domain-containing protein 8-like Protein [Tribolium castaneum]|eukprot:XP_008190715.1 PREDICTED: protein ABHD8 isoform X2 [Tribolium castaneum]
MSEQQSCYCAPCQEFLSICTIKRPVYPLDPVAPDHSEFFLIDSNVRIRVVHVAPENGLKLPNLDLHQGAKRSSLSEEYWFTKWNKPLKIGICRCSFRRSFRLSVAENRDSFEAAPKRIVDVESFVERIIQDTIFEAFQEYYVLRNQNGVINLAYQKSEDDGVVLRKPVTRQPKQCLHKKYAQKKPVIILFHGIGNSADVWWPVIHTLANKGYEVIAPDMLGHGFSSAPNKPNSYTFHNLLIHAITIFDHYTASDDKRKCILIGHSYGCSIVTALYRHRAPQISQLILISGGGPTPLAAPVKNSEISPFGCIHTLFKPLLFCGLKRSFLFSSRGKHFEVCEGESAIPPRILEYISRGQNWPEGDAAFHRRILVPTLLVHGLQDKNVTLVQQCEMERTIPRAFLELIPNAGHMAMIETPEHLSHMILCFIDTWS